MIKAEILPGGAGDFRKPAHPVVFMFLILPFGVTSGYLTVTLAYLFSRAGVSIEQIAGLVAVSLIPQIFKFLWAPLVDITLSVKKWCALSIVISAATIFATGIVPVKAESLPLLTLIIIVSNFAITFVGMAVNSLAAHDTPENLKGRVAGYLQAGNVGGSGVGGGAGLWLAQRLSAVWMVGAILAIACVACCLALFFVKEPQFTVKVASIGKTFKNLLKDVWGALKSKLGYLGLFLCFIPLGTGSASNLWSAVSGDWKASADTVALVTGVAGGLITAVGCLVGGWICDLIDRKVAYLIFGLMQAICAVGMAYSPHTELMFIIWTSIYAVTIGLTYAGFSAFVLEAIGRGAAATKFEIYASLSNTPIYYMTIIVGMAHTRWGASGMLNTEAAFGVLSIFLFYAFQGLVNRRKA